MLFSDIAGQQKIKEKLISSVKNNRIAHAQILFGPEGSGNLPMAIAFAQYIACKNRGETDSCGQCNPCQKIAKLIHPDVHFSFPFNATKQINKALDKIVSDEFIGQWREIILKNPYFNERQWYSHIGIENKQGIIGKSESENITRKLMYKPYESDYKFMIVWLPEYMNPKAANSLLKLVEEPPHKTIFLFVTEKVNNVLPTIFSRTQPVKLQPVSKQEMIDFFNKKQNFDEHILQTAVNLSKGNVIKFYEIIDQSETNAFFLQKFIDLMRMSWKLDMNEINAWIDEMAARGREQMKNFFEFALHMIRENFMLHVDSRVVSLTNDESRFSEKFHPYINGKNVIALNKLFSLAATDIAANAYAKIVLLDVVLKISKLIKR